MINTFYVNVYLKPFDRFTVPLNDITTYDRNLLHPMGIVQPKEDLV